MRILSFTGGAGQMYCGSCLRDNALASALIARGHDVVLTPVYTPTRTDERNVSQHHVVFGGISVFLEQHSSIFRHTPRLLDRLWDAEWVINLAAKRQIKVDPQSLGEMTVSMLRGDQGFQRKEITKLIEWLKTEPRFDVINLPYTLLLGLAEPLKRTLNTPMCCTLQGEDLFLDGLGEPWKQQSMDLIRAASAHVDAFLPVSRYYLDYMPGYLGVAREKMRLVPLGINLDGYAPPATATSGAVHDRLLRAHCTREGPARARRRVSPAAHATRHRRVAPRGGRVSRARASRVSRGHNQRSDGVGTPGDSSSIAARWTARRRSTICAASMSCRSRPRTRNRKGIFLLEAMAMRRAGRSAAARSVSRGRRDDRWRSHRRGGQSRGPG